MSANIVAKNDLSNVLDEIILDKLKNVDGEGSGLDADLIRGLPADFTCDLSENGYTKLPNGLIIQWGTAQATGTNSIENFTFPITFPNVTFSVVVTMTDDSKEFDPHSGISIPGVTIRNITNTGCQIVNDGNETHKFKIIAIGY